MTPTRHEIANWRKFHELFSAAFAHEALGTAAELEIADALRDEPTTAQELASRLRLDAGALKRLLRALSAYGIFEEVDGAFQHNAFSQQLKQSHPFTYHGMARLWHSAPMRRAWGSFPAAIRSGQAAFLHGNGKSVYEHLQEDPATAELFHQAMENNSAIVADAVACGFPFSDYDSVIDLGGGVGTLLAAILKHHNIQGAVYDLPIVAPAARAFLERCGLGERARYIEGDWFEAIPSGFDVYVVKNSLWNWTDEQCAKILANTGRAMGCDARLLVIEYMPDPRNAPWTTAFDLQQLNVTGGRGRTVEEYRELLGDAGIEIKSVFHIENEHVLHCGVR